MDPTITIAPSPAQSLEAARTTPIAELCPDVADPATHAVGGVVTITWPYNKVEGTFAFNLAEPNFRLRRNKGQVRIDFTGRAAKAAGDCGLGSNDEVLISLAGAAWEAEIANKRRSLPGADIGWRLVFSDYLLLRIKRADTSKIDLVVVNEQSHEDEATLDSTHTEPLAPTKSNSPFAPLSPIRFASPVRETNTKQFNDGEFASPAFVKRARMSYGSLFEGGFDVFQEDGAVEGRRRKRTRFGRDSSAWRYTSRSPTPESAASPSKGADEQISSPTRVVSSPTMVEMGEEAWQTMELVQSPAPPTSTFQDAEIDIIAPEQILINDAPTDTPTEAAAEAATGRRTQTPPSDSWPSESAGEATIQNTPAPISSDVPSPDFGAPTSHSDKELGPTGYNFTDGAWNVGIARSAFEPRHKASSALLRENEAFASSGFKNIISSNQPTFDESNDLSRSIPGGGENQESINDGIIHSTELDVPAFSYPPLGAVEDTHDQAINDEALTNYPTSYLEDNPPFQPRQTIEEQIPQGLEAAETGQSSWATVNHSPQVPIIPSPDRLGNRDGDTPEQALVIDESDSDADSDIEAIAMEDAVDNSRAYTRDIFDDAEAEDEVDAQYSDDDEPEYDEDEMGGDYDTRNYEQPADDDDDSHDEDLKPHQLDPEFGDGESWDEEEQEEFPDEEDEGEYETDEEIAEPGPQRTVQATPTVIDLISSSEDENEDEDEDEDEDEERDDKNAAIQQSSAPINYRASPDYQQLTSQDDPPLVHMKDEESEITYQAAISEADSSSEASNKSDENIGPHREEDAEDEDGDYDAREDEEVTVNEMKRNADEQEEIHMLEHSSYQAERQKELEIESKHEAEPDNDATIGNTHDRENSSSHQSLSAVELHENIGVETISEIGSEDLAIVPLSAADGLEVLSRAVDKESDAQSHSVFVESTVGNAVTEPTINEQLPAIPPEDSSIQTQHSSNDQQMIVSEGASEISTQSIGENQHDQTASANPDTLHLPLFASDDKFKITAPSSPPLTQSFRSHIEDDKSAYEEITITSTSQLATVQLETPLDTQVTDCAPIATTNTSVSIEESSELYTAIEQQILDDMESSILEKPVEDFVPRDTNTYIDKIGVQQKRDSGLIVELQAHPTPDKPPTVSSPALSFQTQVDDEELVLPDDLEQTQEDNQVPRKSSLSYDSNASDTDKSFASHLDVDEELQASILEHSQLEENSIQDLDDEDNESVQIDPSEAYTESEYTGKAETVSSSLQENTPSRQLADEISTQLRRNFVSRGSSYEEDSDSSMRNDPSVHLARVANAAKRGTRKRAASTPLHHPRKRMMLDARRSPTPETDYSSIRLARASLTSQASRSEEESSSMTAAKLQLARHLRDELPDCTSLEALRQHLTKSLDVIAVAVMQPPDPQRAKNGPREYMMSFTIADYTIGPYAVVEVLIYRPHKDTLPVVKYGDIVLLRNFTVVSLPNKGYGLRTNDRSSWAVFDYEHEPPQIRGPPVEYSSADELYVSYLREWFRLLDVNARAKLERANKKLISAGKSK
ncbi:hypothetical protein GGS24DRAFT_244669 [Hypoxylon argillaceum]|nr:hypothetical protein GGS24DRAFT_244669 [Hypoxylon argillaceum]